MRARQLGGTYAAQPDRCQSGRPFDGQYRRNLVLGLIASHSSCRAIADIPRNMTDEMLRALAKNGGVVGVNFGAAFLHPEDAQEFKAVLAKLKASEGGIPNPADLDSYAAQDYKQRGLDRATTANATVKDVADHIDHIVKVAGIDHVGIGSDFDGVPTLPKGLEDASKMPALTAELLQRGYSEQDIYKIMGGNLLRVIREVEGR